MFGMLGLLKLRLTERRTVMPYSHFNYFDRCDIQRGLEQGLSKNTIAKTLGRHRTSVTREIQRNGNKNGQYNALDAQYKYIIRQRMASPVPKLAYAPLRDFVEIKLKTEWSPEQISNMLELEFPDDPRMRISHESIYQHVYDNKLKGGDLHTHLRQGHKKRRPRGGGKNKRGGIKNRTSIESRPAIVDAQERLGDYEGDSVQGRNHKRPIATFVDRRTLFLTAAFMDDKRASSMNDAACRAFEQIPEGRLKTLTVDNGTEFAGHEKLAKSLGIDIYFAHPHSPNERAINENTNGLIRQYLPKGTDFTQVPDEYLQEIVEKLNNRPRAKLGFRTPKEMFESGSVALQI